MARFAAAVCLALAMLALCNGQIPSFEECDATFDRIGEDSLTTTLTPCAVGDNPSPACCQAIAALTNVNGGGELAGCLCQQQVIDGVIGVLEGNALASAVGFDGARLNNVLSQCGSDAVGSNNCNQSPPPPEETPSFEVTETPADPAPPEEPTTSPSTESTFEVTTTPAPPTQKDEPSPPVPTPPGKLPPRPKATAKAKQMQSYYESESN